MEVTSNQSVPNTLPNAFAASNSLSSPEISSNLAPDSQNTAHNTTTNSSSAPSITSHATSPQPLAGASDASFPPPKITSTVSTNPTSISTTAASWRERSWSSITQYWLRPLTALLVYALTLGIAFSASSRNSLLGVAKASVGTWILSILSKAGDIFFAFAVADTFDSMAWGKMKQVGNSSEPVKLPWFLAMVSSTGIFGLLRLFTRGLKRRMTRSNTSPSSAVKGGWKARWSFYHLLFLLVLIPGPGVILVADINQRNVFFPTGSMNVSAGLGVYDPLIATVTRSPAIGLKVSSLVRTMLQDRSYSWPLPPISSACKASETCKSYLLAGPSLTVAPWPFDDKHVDAEGFKLAEAPFYQVELWDVKKEENIIFSESKDCELYGGFNASTEFSTLVCLSQQSNSENILTAGWSSCQLGYSPTNGSCLAPASLTGRNAWSVHLSFYRRKATVIFSRNAFDILSVSDLSEAIPQNIGAASLFPALNNVLYRPHNQSITDQRYDLNSQTYVLTQTISSDLWYSLNERFNGSLLARDSLRNILTMPVYLFQPTIIPIESQTPLDENGESLQPNLPRENYITGSYVTVDKRSIPGMGTLIGYACAGALVLMFVFVGKSIAFFRWPEVEMSDFPLLDYSVLAMLLNQQGQGGGEVMINKRMGGRKYRTGVLMDEIGDVSMRLRTPTV